MHIDRILDAADKRERKYPWIGICIHHTGIGDRERVDNEDLWKRLNRGIADWLTVRDSFYVSANYQIGRFGELTQLVDPEDYVAYHAGKCRFWHPIYRKESTLGNDSFIGIEMLGDGNKQPYSADQYDRLVEVCHYLMAKYPEIHPACILGHEMIAPGRKTDPGPYFDWKLFYGKLYAQESPTQYYMGQ